MQCYLQVYLQDSSLRDIFRKNANDACTTLSLLFMKGFKKAIIPSEKCYLFDSHGDDERGLSVIDVTSVLMKFNDLIEIVNTFK